MKKLLVLLFSFCFLLTGCNKPVEPSNEDSSSSSSITPPMYTQEEIRQKLKSSCFEYQSRIKDKTQFTLNGEFNAPDTEFNGMFMYKNLGLTVDSNILDPYLKMNADIYLKENNVVNDIPNKRIEIIQVNDPIKLNGKLPSLEDIQKLSLPSYEYVLEEFINPKNKIYSKTVDPTGGTVFSGAIGAITQVVKEFEIDDLPKTIEYSYNRDNVSYGMKIKFKDLEGTPLSEYMNILLGFVPELNELLLQFKDEITINLNNIKLDTPTSTFDLDIIYPAMQGMFEFEVIHGSFNLNFKNIIRDDLTKLKIKDTYLKGKVGNNLVGSYQKAVEEDGVTKYKAGVVLDTLSTIDVRKIDINNIDFIKLLKNKKVKINAPGAVKIEYFDRYEHTPIKIKNSTIDLSLLDKILIEFTYENNTPHSVEVSIIENEDDNNNDNVEEL